MYGIVAHCPRTGRIGAALASASIAAGGRCLAVRPGVGLVVTQATPASRQHALALNLLAAGTVPAGVLRELEGMPQATVLAVGGACAVRTDPGAPGWAGDRTAPGSAAFGTALAGPQVPEAMLAGFEAGGEMLEDRLMAALVAGREAGAPASRSAVLSVWGRERFSDLDLRVDLHEDAVGELRATLAEYKPYVAYYLERAESPRTLLPQEQFAAQQGAREAGAT